MVTAILFVHLLFAVLIFFLTLAFVTGAPFVPSAKPVANTMIRLAKIAPGMNVYDLGAGDGRLLLLAGDRGASAIGFEINPFLVIFTKIKIWLLHKQQSTHIHWKNFWTARFSDADVVFVYLLPWKMEQLQKKLIKELKPGTRIVSNSFVFPGLKLVASDAKNHVYLFII